jgi:diguanylate cyclase (GGDEF)-like protein
MRAGHLSTFSAGTIHAELRFQAGSDVVWGRTTITVARQPGDLPDALVLTIEDLTDERRKQAKLEAGRRHDPATGLPEATLLAARLRGAIRGAWNAGPRLALLMLEIDRLGAIDEELGEEAANAILEQLTERLQAQVRPRDFVARTGGNEFGIILGEVDEAELAVGVGKRVLNQLAPEFKLTGGDLQVPVSMGVAIFPDDGRDAETLIRRARFQMYGAVAPEDAEPEAEATDELEQRVAALEPVSLFLSVPDRVLRRIARYMSAQTAVPGEELVGPATPAALRIIHEGLCEIRTADRLPLLTLGPGDFMGLDQLLGEKAPPVSVHALTDCKLLVLDAPSIEKAAPAGTPFWESLRKAAEQRTAHLRALIERPRRARAAAPATNFAIYSPKGGAGRTTLAVNLASELGRRFPGEVLLVDLSLPFNHVALLAGQSPSTCLARTANAPGESFRHLVWSAVLPHAAGFMTLPTALRPEEAELVTPELLTRALEIVAADFTYVVFDVGVPLDERALTALEIADQVILIASPELAALHDLRIVHDLMTGVLEVPAGRIHTVLNHRAPETAMSRAAVEEVLRRPVATEFRYHGVEPELTAVEGRIQAKAHPRSQYSRALAELLSRLEMAIARSA